MSKSESIKVVVRFRPVNKRERKEKVKLKCELKFSEDGQSVEVKLSDGFQKKFNYDRVMRWDTPQRDAYEYCCRRIVDDVLSGYTGTIFAYGQTGSGKTYTILGSEDDADLNNDKLMGFIPRVADDIFGAITGGKSDISCKVQVEYCEIYLNRIYDLFSKTRKALRIRQSTTETYVEGLSKRPVSSVLQVIEYLKFGSEHRFMRATSMNARSSRSHSLFVIRVERTDKFSGTTTTGKFNLVDLAGSEKVQKTGAAGDMLEEAKKINQSLSALGNVINALVLNRKHIPYRDSPLTRILSDALGGNSKTTIVCTASPHAFNMMETISTLRFGERAKKIKCKVKANVQLSREQLIRIVDQLKKALRKEEKKSLAYLDEIKKLKGDEFTDEYHKGILKALRKKKVKKGSKNNEEEEEEGEEDDQIAGSFAELEIREELKTWKLKCQDKDGEILSLKEASYEKVKGLRVKLEKFKKVLVQISQKLKKTENENTKFNSKMVLMKQEVQKVKDDEEGVLLEWKEKLKFAEEDVDRLTKEVDLLKDEKDEMKGRMSIYEEMGSTVTIKNMIQKKNEKMKNLEDELEKKLSEFSQFKSSTEDKIKTLDQAREKRSEQCFSLLKKNDVLQKEKGNLKKFVLKLSQEKKMVLKLYAREKEKIRNNCMQEHKKNLEEVKKYYKSTNEQIVKEKNSYKNENEELKNKVDELEKRPYGVVPVSATTTRTTTSADGAAVMYSPRQQQHQQASGGRNPAQVSPSGSNNVVVVVPQQPQNESEVIAKLKNAQQKKIRRFMNQFKLLKKLASDKEKKNKERHERFFKLLQQKEEALKKAKVLKDKKVGLVSQMKEKMITTNKDWQDKLTLLFKKLQEMKTTHTHYKKQFNQKTVNKGEVEKLERERELFNRNIKKLKDNIRDRDEQIEKLQIDVIDASKHSSDAGSITMLEKKFGNKLDILNELRGMRVMSKRVLVERERYRNEVKTQREQLRSNRVKIKKLMFEKQKTNRQILEMRKQIEGMMVNFQTKLDDKERKVTKLEIDIGQLEKTIEEFERLEEINNMFLPGNIDDDDDVIYRSPPRVSGRMIISIDEPGEHEEEEEEESKKEDRNIIETGEYIDPKTPTKKRKRRASGHLRSPSLPSLSTSSQSPKDENNHMSEIQKYISSNRGQRVRNQRKKKKPPALRRITSGDNVQMTPPGTPNKLSSDNKDEFLKPKPKRMMRRRSKSFSVQRTRKMNEAINNKKFANLAGLKGVKDSPYSNVLLRKTNHGLW